jgi:hypothetical protein
MTKRHADPTHGPKAKVKKRKGVKVRTVNVPDSDDEGCPPNIDTEYVRLLKTRIATSGKADSITTSSLAISEAKEVVHDDSLEPTIDNHEEVAVENTIRTTKVKKRRKKANDSVRCVLSTNAPC